jgi:single-stranded-DNA-specific exonuclease
LENILLFESENRKTIAVMKSGRYEIKKTLSQLEELYSIGEGKHTRLRLSSGANVFYAVMFGRTRESFYIGSGSVVDIAFTVEVNEYQGKRSVSYKIKGIRPSGFSDDVYERSVHFASKVRGLLPFSAEEKAEFKPTREDFVKVYSVLSEKGFAGDSDELAFLLPMPYGKIYAIITAFSSLGLITIGKKGGNIVIRVNENAGKVNLETAEIMTRF